MSNSLQSVRVERFKGIVDAPFDATEINVFIGANNSGKSTLVQMLHFAVGILQSIELAGKWGSKPSVALSLSPMQLLYSPCVDLYALGQGGRLSEDEDDAIKLSLVLNSGEEICIKVRRGRNGNIHVNVDNVPAARSRAALEKPFTIYSPGLAGIARNEPFISNGVLLRTIARGDANLVLRNILWRLSLAHEESWQEFIEDLKKIFPEINIEVRFESETDEYILVYAETNSGRIPIELAGTGILQAAQILGYVHYFHPSVIILDEPDSHLHPNNQRLLCKLLQVVAEERATQVFLTTHSRHVVDALSGQASFLWVRNGTVERMKQDHDIAVLLDIGALDVKEMLSNSRPKCIVLTEDALKRGLETLLESSGIPMQETCVLSYYGCTDPHNLRPLLALTRESNPAAKIVLHRDRDYMNEAEVEKWETEIRKMGVNPFLTIGVDVESHFLIAKHLARLNEKTEKEISELIDGATIENRNLSIEKYVNGRTDIAKKTGTFGSVNIGQLATSAPGEIDSNPERYRHSKTVLKTLRRHFQEHYGCNMRVVEASPELEDDALAALAKKL